jgi:hypothetical protein
MRLGELSEKELVEDGLVGLGCANPETGFGLFACGAGVGAKDTEGEPLSVLNEFYEGIQEAASLKE